MTARTEVARAESAYAFSPQRVAAMMLRYWYLLRSSWPRLIELIYWPAVQMITWGFIQYYVMQNAGFFARAGGTLIGAVVQCTARRGRNGAGGRPVKGARKNTGRPARKEAGGIPGEDRVQGRRFFL
jgi:hypothetical protein